MDAVVINLSSLTTARSAMKLGFVVNPQAPGIFVNAEARSMRENGSDGLAVIEQALIPPETLQWCTIAMTGQVLLWSDLRVLAIAEVSGVGREDLFFMFRTPSGQWLEQMSIVRSEWTDFILDPDRVLGIDRREDRLAEMSPLDPYLHHITLNWLQQQLSAPVDVAWFGVSSLGRVFIYSRDLVIYTYIHLGVERLVVLPRSPSGLSNR